MNYKSIALAGLLLPFFVYSQENANRIKELKEAKLQKAYELKEITNRMSESYEFYISSLFRYDDLMEIAIQRKLHDSKDSEVKRKQIEQEIKTKNESICEHLKQAFLGEAVFDYELTQELFDQENINNIGAFDTLKFFYIRAVVERDLLTALVDCYQVCLRELLAINQELMNLEQ